MRKIGRKGRKSLKHQFKVGFYRKRLMARVINALSGAIHRSVEKRMKLRTGENLLVRGFFPRVVWREEDVIVTPETYFADDDKQRGYSWNTDIGVSIPYPINKET